MKITHEEVIKAAQKIAAGDAYYQEYMKEFKVINYYIIQQRKVSNLLVKIKNIVAKAFESPCNMEDTYNGFYWIKLKQLLEGEINDN